jgi:hypothetical protein
VNKRPDLPCIVRSIDGRWCKVPIGDIGTFDQGRKQRLRSTLGLTASPIVAAELESNSKQALDRRLDQALEETFPASDPISVICD